MPNIRDVAKDANVSIATVSRILSEDPTYKASAETRARVYASVKELGYIYKNRSHKNQNLHVGCILGLTAEKYSDPFFTGILSALESRLLEHNYTISVVRSLSELQDPRTVNTLLESNLSGLILMENLPDDLFNIIRSNIEHIVCCDNIYEGLDNIRYDPLYATRSILSHLKERNYKHIAYIGGMTSDYHGIDKRQIGIRCAATDFNIIYEDEDIFDCEWDVTLAQRFVQEILTRSTLDRPDAIIAGNDTLAVAILSHIQKLGFSVPKDIAVVGFNDDPASAYSFPALTTVHVPVDEIGRATADRLYHRIKGDNSVAREVLFPTRLVIRHST